ncbi:MAG: hypothetical protein DRG25_03690 [Deltaproteobacteria bacterium]|nr:MAG: hypothetical protein DRG25_03690 [Deltaproteobacteria bacterium]
MGNRVIVLTPLPGRVKANVVIDIPRPRSRLDKEIHLAQKVIISELEGKGNRPTNRGYKLFDREKSECENKI